MRYILPILLLLSLSGLAQNPTGNPVLQNSKWYRFTQYLGVDSAILFGNKDTNWTPRQPAIVLWEHSLVDTSLWLWDRKWKKVGSNGINIDTTNIPHLNRNNYYTNQSSNSFPYLVLRNAIDTSKYMICAFDESSTKPWTAIHFPKATYDTLGTNGDDTVSYRNWVREYIVKNGGGTADSAYFFKNGGNSFGSGIITIGTNNNRSLNIKTNGVKSWIFDSLYNFTNAGTSGNLISFDQSGSAFIGTRLSAPIVNSSTHIFFPNDTLRSATNILTGSNYLIAGKGNKFYGYPNTGKFQKFIVDGDSGVYYITPTTASQYATASSVNSALALKLNIGDTSTMLSPYLRKSDTLRYNTALNAKLNKTDTSSMLSPYLRSNVAAATYQPILTAGSNITITSNTIAADTSTGSTKLATQGYVSRNSSGFSPNSDTTITANYTITTRDVGRNIYVNNASTVTVTFPSYGTAAISSTSPSPQKTVTLWQMGTGSVVVAAGSGATISVLDGATTTIGQYAAATAVVVSNSNWYIAGALR